MSEKKIEDYLPNYIDEKNDEPAVFEVANHSSTLEPFIMMNTTDHLISRPVAKAMLSDVPGVGLFLRSLDCIFITRESKEKRGEVIFKSYYII